MGPCLKRLHLDRKKEGFVLQKSKLTARSLTHDSTPKDGATEVGNVAGQADRKGLKLTLETEASLQQNSPVLG